jgi:hypothetical protein
MNWAEWLFVIVTPICCIIIALAPWLAHRRVYGHWRIDFKFRGKENQR